ncbi:MAG: phosphoribosylformylglycinamidine cyclo-ligase [Candidatus Eisenbacteria bacterium]|nr:phosphoribosylformylglycinamidine cyclo-ligase [Candidatus Eisenbacteria bacterium]
MNPPASRQSGATYRAAGVDRGRAAAVRDRIRAHCAATHGPAVVSGIGGFGGCLALPQAGADTVLVASVDGVGTKMRVAALTGQWETVGYDIVAHGVNDVLVQGAAPLFFLDYIAMSRLDAGVIEKMVSGMARACREAGCAILGGETAEMPGVYRPDDAELVGTMVGWVRRDRLLGAPRVKAGDQLIGLPSSGLHTNGYTLARKLLLEEGGPGLEARPEPLAATVGEALMAPHTMYWAPIRPLLDEDLVHAMAHVTGGGMLENLPRVLPEGCEARLVHGSWETPPIFRLLQQAGRISTEEMYRVFNLGVGMILIAGRDGVGRIRELLGREGEDYWLIGDVVEGRRGVAVTGLNA